MRTSRHLIALAAAGSAALLAAAFVFQALGWQPCKMCLWQRWPHAAAVVLGGIALLSSSAQRIAFAAAGTLAALATAGIAAYHTGVERKWWDGPASCSGGTSLTGLSADDLLPSVDNAPALVMCDDLTPFFLGLTMANWNMLASLGLALIWATAIRRAFS